MEIFFVHDCHRWVVQHTRWCWTRSLLSPCPPPTVFSPPPSLDLPPSLSLSLFFALPPWSRTPPFSSFPRSSWTRPPRILFSSCLSPLRPFSAPPPLSAHPRLARPRIRRPTCPSAGPGLLSPPWHAVRGTRGGNRRAAVAGRRRALAAMLIKEYRLLLPMTLEEVRRAPERGGLERAWCSGSSSQCGCHHCQLAVVNGCHRYSRCRAHSHLRGRGGLSGGVRLLVFKLQGRLGN